ncbi:pantoate--beta-alanine ligase [Candidatus Roizmanbacteria bacterium]|nr:MAG: pantoate--beta-alanine ligase [Candidatus Roizmanbacteria bacterium]
MTIYNNIKQVKNLINEHVKNGKSIGFIPTMGALHIGHLSLVQQARRENDIVAVSVFVNPKQFNNPDDLKRYPRTIEHDKKLIEDYADVLFIPEADEIYPEGFGTTVHVFPLADIAEGAFRPGHFDGMSTVVLKLFNLVQPTRAYFGKKDYQQYLIVRQMVRDLNVPVQIVGCDTVRESTGLALSSRNMRLTPKERLKAAVIYQALSEAKKCIINGERDTHVIRVRIEKMLSVEPLWRTEYIEIRSIQDFSEPLHIMSDSVILIAGYMGEVRLIDNIEIPIS